ncbi:hypothetical protein [Kordiimonas sp. SCSIO 12610]|uniref:hypothetical protein n=1 Tax=Kordiimonas sp. SCSIO 12610 TaxID=2829597 RepID=UPI0021090B77|nr:hypothetical protein [Kordiimonas sp. SCSIO 12610]UTW54996.1 hypothetical protein KFF44_14495 [Kordiimonas sp. SCSIO 12610]
MFVKIAILFAIFSLSPAAFADEEKLSRGEKRLASIMEKYEKNGKIKRCVNLRRLRESKVIDDKTIFFRGIGKTGYLNRLNGNCIGLAREERFSYSTTINQLCRGEILTVLDNFGRPWGSCGLGEFEELSKKTTSDSVLNVVKD